MASNLETKISLLDHSTTGNLSPYKLFSIFQQIGTGQDHERDPSERAYNLVTKAYFGSKEYRNAHRLVTYH